MQLTKEILLAFMWIMKDSIESSKRNILIAWKNHNILGKCLIVPLVCLSNMLEPVLLLYVMSIFSPIVVLIVIVELCHIFYIKLFTQ